MTTSWPEEFDPLPTDKTEDTKQKDDHPETHNKIADLLNALQVELGLNPSRAALPQTKIADLTEPIIVPHRMGGMNYAPDNAIEAGEALVERGFRCIDGGDVRATADKTLVNMHDLTLTRTALGNASSPVNVQDHTIGSWKNVQLDPSRYLAPGWSRLLNAPTFEDVLKFGKARGVCLTPECKTDSWVDVSQPMVDAIVRYGMQESVIFQCFNLAPLAAARAAGLRTCFLIQSEATPTADIIAADVDYVAYSIGTPPLVGDAYLNTLVAAGIKLGIWTLTRQTELADEQARGRPIAMAHCDDAIHVKGGTDYIATTDRFKAGTWMAGMRHASANGGIRGSMLYGKYQQPSGNLWMMMGSMRMVNSMQVTITYEALAADTTRWCGIGFGCVNDRTWNDGVTPVIDAYVLILRESGSMALFKRPGGQASTQLGSSVSTPALSAGSAPVLKVEWVGATDIKVTRVDTGHTLTVTDTSMNGGVRGQFFHLGKSDSGGGLVASFSGVQTT